MSANPSTIVEHRDALDHLRQQGFARLIAALGDPTCYTVGGRLNKTRVAQRLRKTRKALRVMLAQGASAAHYIDAGEFTRLFHARTKNHQAICRQLALIAAGAVVKIARHPRPTQGPSSHDWEDLEADAVIHLIECIPRFDPPAGNAFSYFSTVALNFLRKELPARAAKRSRCVLFTDLDEALSNEDSDD
jgi:hypothetical protein